MKKYMSYCSQYLCHKNKLEEAFKEFIKTYDRQIFGEDKCEMFKKFIIDGVDFLNKKFPRCTPIKISFWSPGSMIGGKKDEDILLDDSSRRVIFRLLLGDEF